MSVRRGIGNPKRLEARAISQDGGERNLALAPVQAAAALRTASVTASKASMVEAWRAG
jgi:hypothetical protein